MVVKVDHVVELVQVDQVLVVVATMLINEDQIYELRALEVLHSKAILIYSLQEVQVNDGFLVNIIQDVHYFADKD